MPVARGVGDMTISGERGRSRRPEDESEMGVRVCEGRLVVGYR